VRIAAITNSRLPSLTANSIQAIESPAALADTIASFLDVKPAEKQELLEVTEIRERLERVSTLLTRRVEVLRLSQEIGERTKENISDRERKFLLREQLKTIQKELGEEGEHDEDIARRHLDLPGRGQLHHRSVGALHIVAPDRARLAAGSAVRWHLAMP